LIYLSVGVRKFIFKVMKTDKAASQFSIDFRDLVVKVIKEDLSLKTPAKIDPVALTERYKLLLDNVNGFVLVSNYTTGLYEYISHGVYAHLGYDVTKFTNEELTDFMISVIRDEHRDFMVNTLLPVVLSYFKENSTRASGLDYRYSVCMQLRNIGGNYFWYLVDTVLIEVDENGFPIRTLITCTNIDQFKKDQILYYNVTKKNDSGVYEVMLEGTGNTGIDELKITKREVQIINLISSGLTNRQIAEKLFISENTVGTHRKNIMKKTQCNGIAELTNFAFSRGLL
jgi:DNA-binding CsgD family transcriptional regulator